MVFNNYWCINIFNQLILNINKNSHNMVSLGYKSKQIVILASRDLKTKSNDGPEPRSCDEHYGNNLISIKIH